MEQVLVTVAKACKSQSRSLEKNEFNEALNQKTPCEAAGQALKVVVRRVLSDYCADVVKRLFVVVRTSIARNKNV